MKRREVNYWTFLIDCIANAQVEPISAPPAFSLRDEANVLTAYALRNSFLEDLHAGVAGFSDEEMRRLMVEASGKLAAALFLKTKQPKAYAEFLREYGREYCGSWDRLATAYELREPAREPCVKCSRIIRASWAFCPACGVPQRAGP